MRTVQSVSFMCESETEMAFIYYNVPCLIVFQILQRNIMTIYVFFFYLEKTKLTFIVTKFNINDLDLQLN